MQNIVGVCY